MYIQFTLILYNKAIIPTGDKCTPKSEVVNLIQNTASLASFYPLLKAASFKRYVLY